MLTVYHLNESRSVRILWLLEEIGAPHQIVRFERDATRRAPAELADAQDCAAIGCRGGYRHWTES